MLEARFTPRASISPAMFTQLIASTTE